jgi:hypothetical protein
MYSVGTVRLARSCTLTPGGRVKYGIVRRSTARFVGAYIPRRRRRGWRRVAVAVGRSAFWGCALWVASVRYRFRFWIGYQR